MSSLRKFGRLALASSALALIGAQAQAAVMWHVGGQPPKANLISNDPPDVVGLADAARSAFTSELDRLGGYEFERTVASEAPPLNFTYANGAATATITGGAVPFAGVGSNPTLGRYNMTPNDPALGLVIPSPAGGGGRGNWIEASSNFEVSFGQAISAFSFFTTDLGDYNGDFILDLLDANGNLVDSRRLENTLSGETVDDQGNRGTSGNGNLLFVGVTSSDPLKTFSRAVFKISQCSVTAPGCDGNTDVLGFDSFVVGNYKTPTGGTDIPEPTSLALVGLGLLAAGWSRKAKRAT